ncbi:MAG: FHA domain-containing protein, partial [Ruminococcus sp.]|nr:FHA domain-containing protein [Ruminococcus sp.]
MKNYISFSCGGNPPLRFCLESFGKDTVRLGRGPVHGNSGNANDICIPADITVVSRAHCVFFRTPGGWAVKDSGGVNGLFMNGVKTDVHELHSGDKLYIGTNADRC